MFKAENDANDTIICVKLSKKKRWKRFKNGQKRYQNDFKTMSKFKTTIEHVARVAAGDE